MILPCLLCPVSLPNCNSLVLQIGNVMAYSTIPVSRTKMQALRPRLQRHQRQQMTRKSILVSSACSLFLLFGCVVYQFRLRLPCLQFLLVYVVFSYSYFSFWSCRKSEMGCLPFMLPIHRICVHSVHLGLLFLHPFRFLFPT